MTRARTIMADTKVSPTSTIEPGFWAAAVVASPRASKERLEYMALYSGRKVLREGIEKKKRWGSSWRRGRGGR
jgi:hypothetical protein